MEAIVLVLVMVLIVGGMTLMLAMGYASTEKERAAREHAIRTDATSEANAILSLPTFFEPSRRPAPIAFVFDDGLVRRVEDHVRGEQALVAQFIHQPSIDNLYRKSKTDLRAN